MTQSNRPAAAPRTGAVRGQRVKATKGRRRFPWKGLGLTFLALVLLGIGLAGLAYSMVDIPKPNELAQAQKSTIYYADGKTQLTELGDVNREMVDIAKVPEKTRQAVIAAEDRDFYDNPGISITGLGRAVIGALRGQDAGGGSTITQQYVKNYFLTSDQTLSRKGKEIIIAVKIDRELSKDQILENYLNTIYFGRNSYGIQKASQAYFGKDVSQLDVSESAFIAAVINQPSVLDPAAGGQAKAVERWNYVLEGMVTKGWLTDAQRTALKFPQIVPPTQATILGGTRGYLVDVVKNELLERGIKDSDIAQGGLKITTTIDPTTQKDLEDAVKDKTPASGVAAGVRVGAVAIKPGDGAILALYGGSDFATRPFNDATQGHMQAGSTFKTFATLAALQQGISTRTAFSSDTPYKPAGTTDVIHNWDERSHGMVDLPQMLAGSINTAFVRLNEKVKPDNTLKAAVAAGLPQDGPEDDYTRTWGLDNNVANVLGSAAVRPVDLANAYATIAAEGQRAKPYIVQSVAGPDGQQIFATDKELSKAFDKDVADDTIDALRAVTRDGGTGSGASAVGRPVAGKTGTSNESKSAWFAGFTPEVATAVGMYMPDPQTGAAKSMDGYAGLGSGAAPVNVWAQFTRDYLKGKPVTDFPKRAGIGDDKVWTPPPAPRTSSPAPSTSSAPTTTSSAPTTTAVPTGTPTDDPGTLQPTAPTPTPTQRRQVSPTSVPAQPNALPSSRPQAVQQTAATVGTP